MRNSFIIFLSIFANDKYNSCTLHLFYLYVKCLRIIGDKLMRSAKPVEECLYQQDEDESKCQIAIQ